jgi:type II secretion system protein H
MRTQNGFTIIELLTVMAMICMITAISVPAYRSFVGSADIRSAADQLRADVWLARQRAIATSQPHSLFFDLQENSYTIFRDDGDGVPNDAANGVVDDGEEILLTRDLRDGFFLTAVNLDPDNAVIMMPKGMLKTGTVGGDLTISNGNTSRTLLIRASGQCKVE